MYIYGLQYYLKKCTSPVELAQSSLAATKREAIAHKRANCGMLALYVGLKLYGTHLRNLKLFLHALPNLKVMFFKEIYFIR